MTGRRWCGAAFELWIVRAGRASEPDLDCGLSESAEVRRRIWLVDLPGRRGFGAEVGLWIYRAGGGSGPDSDCGFSGSAGIPLVRRKFI